jgi:citrate synthase
LKEMARDLAKEKGREEEFAFLELLEERSIQAFYSFKGNKASKNCTCVHCHRLTYIIYPILLKFL